jgi:hypothetical protein
VHKFKVGQMVDLIPSRSGGPGSVRTYKILRLLPQVGVERLYRIKTIMEPCERIVEESNLVCRCAPVGRMRSVV